MLRRIGGKRSGLLRLISLLSVCALVLPLFAQGFIDSAFAADGSQNPDHDRIPPRKTNTQPVVGSKDDPWPTDYTRPDDSTHDVELKNNRVALIFDFHGMYTWETLGGYLPKLSGTCPSAFLNTSPTGCRPNRDQVAAIKQNIARLRGFPMSLGVYTSDSTTTPARPYAIGNPPNLPSTSIETQAGYQKVMSMLDRIDATGGTGKRLTNGNTSQLDFALRQVVKDNARAKYTDIVIFSPGINLQSQYTSDNDGKLSTIQQADKLRRAGVNIHVMAMGQTYSDKPQLCRIALGPNAENEVDTCAKLMGREDLKNINDRTYVKIYGSQNERRDSIASVYHDWKDFSNAFSNMFLSPPDKSPNDVRNGLFADAVTELLDRSRVLSITNDMVDENFRYVRPNVGVQTKITFNQAGVSVNETKTSGTDGISESDINNRQVTEMRPQAQADKVLTRFNGHNARCFGYVNSKYWETEKSENFYPDNINDAKGNPIGAKLTARQQTAYTHIKCNFYYRDTQPTEITKFVQVNPPIQIANEVKNMTINYEWSCVDPLGVDTKKIIAQGDANRLVESAVTTWEGDIPIGNYRESQGQTAPQDPMKLPVGAKCTIKETARYSNKVKQEIIQRAINHTQSWKPDGNNTKFENTTPADSYGGSIADGLTTSTTATVLYQFTDVNDPLDEDVATTFQSNSSLSGKQVTIDVSMGYAGMNLLPSGQVAPKQIPMYYECRYMADKDKPPELDISSTAPGNPFFVGRGVVMVNTDGTPTKLPSKDGEAWPVGTNCVFTPDIPQEQGYGQYHDQMWTPEGFKFDNKWEADMCLNTTGEQGVKYASCNSNFFWASSEGAKHIHLQQVLKRGEGNLQITKVVDGDAQSTLIGQAFEMNLQCVDENGKSLPIDDGKFDGKINLRPGGHEIIKNVPTHARCTLTQDQQGWESTLKNVDINPTPSQEFTLTSATDTKEVTSTTTANYKRGTLTLSHKTLLEDGTGVSAAEAQGVQKTSTITCTDPNGEQSTVTREYTGDGPQNLDGDYPAGTVCDISTKVTGDLPENTQVSTNSPRIQIAPGGNTVNVTSTFRPTTAGEVAIQVTRTTPAGLEPGLVKLLPTSMNLKVTCGDVIQTAAVKSGDTAIFADDTALLSNSQCTAQLTGADGKTLVPAPFKATLNVSDEGATAQSEDVNARTFTFTSPAEDATKKLDATIAYEIPEAPVSLQANSSLSVDKSELGEDADAALANWKDAFFAGPYASAKLIPSAVCTFGEGENKVERRFNAQVSRIGEGSRASRDLPVGWDCTLTLDNKRMTRIPGSDFKGGALTLDGTSVDVAENDGTTTMSFTVTEDPQELDLALNYQMQTASFNLKKKVGGDGVAVISKYRPFKVSYTCSLNGQPIDVPAPWKIDTSGARPTAIAQRGAFAATQSVMTYRFQQGEWAQVKGLPAGAECSVQEHADISSKDGGVAEDAASWASRWEVMNDFRGRTDLKNSCARAGDRECRPGGEQINYGVYVTLPVDQPAKPSNGEETEKENPAQPKELSENFFGTVVAWNTYTYMKSKVELDLKTSGNGTALSDGTEYTYTLYCKPVQLEIPDDLPADEKKEFEEINEANAAAILREPITLRDTDKDRNGKYKIEVPANYRCILTQQAFNEGDAKVVTSIDTGNADVTKLDADKPFEEQDAWKKLFSLTRDYLKDPDLQLATNPAENAAWVFQIDPKRVEENKNLIKLNVDVNYDRPQAGEITLKHHLDTNILAGNTIEDGAINIGNKLDIGSFNVKYRCEDLYATDSNSKPLVYQGEAELAKDGTAKVPESADLPAGVKCEFDFRDKGKSPIADYPSIGAYGFVSVDNRVDGKSDAKGLPPVVEDKNIVMTVSDVKPVPGDGTEANGTTVTFTTAYLLGARSVRWGLYPQGDRAKDIFGENAQDGSAAVPWDYTCEASALPEDLFKTLGYEQVDGRWVKSGTQSVKPGGTGEIAVPFGSKCAVKRGDVPDAVQSELKKQGLADAWSVLYPTQNEVASTVNNKDPKFESTERPALDLKNGFVLDTEDKAFAAVLVTVYKDKGEIHVQRVIATDGDADRPFRDSDATGGEKVADGAQVFKIYPAIMGGDAPVANREAGSTLESSSSRPDRDNPVPVEWITNDAGEWRFKADVKPGQSYFLEEVRAGAGELMPQLWRFDVVAVNEPNTDAGSFGEDYVVKLAEYTEHAGLVKVQNPTSDGQVDVPTISVATLKSGAMPFTGGFLPWVIAAGLGLLAASGYVVYRRRKELE